MKKTAQLGRLVTDINLDKSRPLGVIIDGYDFDNSEHQYESVFKIKRIEDDRTMMLFLRQDDSFLIV
mgnify:CR=1 FL=1